MCGVCKRNFELSFKAQRTNCKNMNIKYFEQNQDYGTGVCAQSEMQSGTLKSLPVNVMKRLSKYLLLTNQCLKMQLVKLKVKTVSCLQNSITVSVL